MTVLTVEGVFRDGRVELSEIPAGVREPARVLVTFMPGAEMEVGPEPMPPDAQERESLRQAAFARMKRGIPLGGPPYPRREELYDRFPK